MEWLLYMVVSALLLEGLVLFVRGYSFHNRFINGLAMVVEDDDIISFIALLMAYVIVVACMPLIMFIFIKD